VSFKKLKLIFCNDNFAETCFCDIVYNVGKRDTAIQNVKKLLGYLERPIHWLVGVWHGNFAVAAFEAVSKKMTFTLSKTIAQYKQGL
jgi:hypothetical protein